MKTKFLLAFTSLVLILSLILVPGLFPQDASAQAPPPDAVPGELIVGFRGGFAEATAQSALTPALAKVGGTIKKSPSHLRNLLPAAERSSLAQAPQAFLIKVKDSSPKGMAKAIAELKAVRGVQFVEPNGIMSIPEPVQASSTPPEVKLQGITSDPMLIYQWGLNYIGYFFCPTPPTTAPGIAIIDTGVDYNHPDLTGKVVKGPDIVNGDTDPMDDHGHGTHCAGIAAAKTNNYLGIAGVSPNSKIIAIKVLNSQGSGTWFDIAAGITAAANRTDVKIISLSLGGYNPSTLVENAVNYAWSKGKVICAAAGNNNTPAPCYPAAYENCIAVAAANYNDLWKWEGSNWCDWVDIAAPGEDILSTLPNTLYPEGYGSWSGTSMATPFVAGAAARVWAKNPTWTNAQVRAQLENTADPIPPGSLGDPTVNPNYWPEPATGCNTFTDPNRPWLLNLYFALGGTPELASTGICGAVLDAVTANPLIGATVTATRTSPATPACIMKDTTLGEFLVCNLLPGTYKVTISKTGYATVNATGIVVNSWSVTSLGAIPIAPSTPTGRWHVAVVWEGPPNDNDLYGWLPLSNPYTLCYWSGGAMTAFPWARWNYDSFAAWALPFQSISLAKTLPGTYYFALYNYSPPSDEGYIARAFVYYGATLKAIIVSPPLVNGKWWDIGRISGTTWTTVNTIGDNPGPYGHASVDAQTGRLRFVPFLPGEREKEERPGILEEETVSR